MKITRGDRSLIAWTLYFCVLFNVFACGLAHGQTMGLALNGVGGQFCSSQSSPAPASKADPADLSASGWAGSFFVSDLLGCDLEHRLTVLFELDAADRAGTPA